MYMKLLIGALNVTADRMVRHLRKHLTNSGYASTWLAPQTLLRLRFASLISSCRLWFYFSTLQYTID